MSKEIYNEFNPSLASLDELREEFYQAGRAKRAAGKQGRILLQMRMARYEESLRVAIAFRERLEKEMDDSLLLVSERNRPYLVALGMNS